MEFNGFTVGMDNRAAEQAMPPGTLRNAINIDIDNQGRISRRPGRVKAADGIGMHSAFSCDECTLVVSAGRLKQWNDDDSFTDLMPIRGTSVDYLLLNRTIYFTDNYGAWKRQPDGSIVNWGVAPPAEPLIYQAAGNLLAGRYMVAITPISADGVEHGASPIADLTVINGSGIVVNLPNIADPQVTSLRIYMSQPDGEVLYCVAEVPLSVSRYTIMAADDGTGRELNTIGVSNMPAGEAIQYYRGRIYVKRGNIIWYTDALAYDRVRRSKNFLSQAHDIDLFAADTNGIYVCSDKTYFLAGSDPAAFTSTEIFEYGAVPGRPCPIPNSNDVAWFSARGVVRATPNGLINLQEAHVAVGDGDFASLHVREFDGNKQMVASVIGGSVSNMAAQTFIDMEIVRKSGD